MRTLGFVFAVLAVVACGRPESEAPASAPIMSVDAPGPTTPTPAIAPPVAGVASGLEVGIVYAGNMMGELEPCG